MSRHLLVDLIDMQAEDTGHLLINDAFLTTIFEPIASRLTVRSSPESIRGIRPAKRSTRLKPLLFHSSPFRKIPFRLRMILRCLLVPLRANRLYVLQSFEETAAFILTLILPARSKLIVIVTNNLGAINRSDRKLKSWLLGRIFERANGVVIHSSHERKVIRETYPAIAVQKVAMVRFHQFGISRPAISPDERAPVISYLGGGRHDQGLDIFLTWARLHVLSKFRYRLASNVDPEVVKRANVSNPNFEFIPGFLPDQTYWDIISGSAFIMLPYSKEYEGKTSGIFADALAASTPILAPAMQPFISMFERYGEMGLLLDFAKAPPDNLEELLTDRNRYELYQQNMKNASRDHGHGRVLGDYLQAVRGVLARR